MPIQRGDILKQHVGRLAGVATCSSLLLFLCGCGSGVSALTNKLGSLPSDAGPVFFDVSLLKSRIGEDSDSYRTKLNCWIDSDRNGYSTAEEVSSLPTDWSHRVQAFTSYNRVFMLVRLNGTLDTQLHVVEIAPRVANDCRLASHSINMDRSIRCGGLLVSGEHRDVLFLYNPGSGLATRSLIKTDGYEVIECDPDTIPDKLGHVPLSLASSQMGLLKLYWSLRLAQERSDQQRESLVARVFALISSEIEESDVLDVFTQADSIVLLLHRKRDYEYSELECVRVTTMSAIRSRFERRLGFVPASANMARGRNGLSVVFSTPRGYEAWDVPCHTTNSQSEVSLTR
jgi:hypothetical protein